MAGAATVDKALDVLFHLHAAPAPLGLTELGRALDLPKSSCHRLLASLVEREVVERDGRGRYRPGLALLSLGLGVQAAEPLVRAARPVLTGVAERLAETAFLVARRRGTLRVLDRVEGRGLLRAAPAVGDAIPEAPTAVGQLMRAFDANPDATLGPVRTRGWAVNRDAWIEGLSVLAAPIFAPRLASMQDDPADLPVAALALAAASPRFDALGEARIADVLGEAAREVALRLEGGR